MLVITALINIVQITIHSSINGGWQLVKDSCLNSLV